MPEAVIVSAARSPIGRAMKGSLVSMRPDDLAVQMVRAALDKVPALNPHQIDDLILGCGLPGGESGFNMARVVAVELGQQAVEGVGQAAQLVVGERFDGLAEISAVGHRVHGPRQPPHRFEHAPGQPFGDEQGLARTVVSGAPVLPGSGEVHSVGFVRNGLEFGGAGLQEKFGFSPPAPFSQVVSCTLSTLGSNG